jgi:hypothetical protein
LGGSWSWLAAIFSINSDLVMLFFVVLLGVGGFC